jgi:hypothetical protein
MIFNDGNFLADLADPADKFFDSYRKICEQKNISLLVFLAKG